MFKNIFSCCQCSDKLKNNDIEISPSTKARINIPILNKSFIKSNNKINLTNITSNNKLILNLTTKSNSPLFHKRNINKTILPNNLFSITNDEDKEKKKNKVLILPNVRRHRKTNSQSVIKINSALFSNLLNDTVSKNDNISIIKDIENRKKLMLSGELFFGKKLVITPNGLKDNYMKRNERSTYFGIKNLCDFSGNPYNDYLINYKRNNKKNHGSFGEDRIKEDLDKIEDDINNNNYVGEEKSTRVFKICYDKDKDEYKFIYLDQSLLLYYQVENKFVLLKHRKYYFILNEVILSVFVKDDKSSKYKIIIKVENKKNIHKYSFSQDNMPIKIGRLNCDININIKSLSKLHCIIGFDHKKEYFYFQDNCSTNGSILLIKESDIIPIKGKMNFILEKTPFHIEEIQN